MALAVVKNAEGKVLIILRRKKEKTTAVLSWAFPGGVVLTGETKKEAVARETLEETGYFVRASAVISERKHPEFPVYIYYVNCELEPKQPVPIKEKYEVGEVKWVWPKEIPDHFTSDYDPKVAKFLADL